MVYDKADNRREAAMEFGYFTLSDNHYENNRREANSIHRRHRR